MGISTAERVLLSGALIFAAIVGGYQLGNFNFEIDELILTEGIEKPFSEYMGVNDAYLPALKVSMWFSDRMFGGGPFAWRIPSFVSWALMIVLTASFLVKENAPHLALSFLIVISLGNASVDYARWGMVSYSLSSLLLLLAFVVISKAQKGNAKLTLSSIVLLLLCMALAFVYFGELVSLIVLGIIGVLTGSRRFVLWGGVATFLMILISLGYYLCYAGVGPGLEPRTSIKYLYFPLSEYESFPLFFADRSLQLFAGVFAFSENLSVPGKLFLGGGVLASLCLHSVQSDRGETARWILILGLWILGSITAYASLSYLGKGPYGDVRYMKGLIWAFPLFLLGLVGLIVRSITNLLSRKSVCIIESVSKWTQLLCYSVGSILIIKGVVSDRLKDRAGFDQLVSAMRSEADLVIVDELHSFAFRYLNPERAFFTMSRSYPCEDGRFWNAYGWNPCTEMKDVVSDEVRMGVRQSDFNSLLVVSRGPFDSSGYPDWTKLVIVDLEYVKASTANFKGPYVNFYNR